MLVPSRGSCWWASFAACKRCNRVAQATQQTSPADPLDTNLACLQVESVDSKTAAGANTATQGLASFRAFVFSTGCGAVGKGRFPSLSVSEASSQLHVAVPAIYLLATRA